MNGGLIILSHSLSTKMRITVRNPWQRLTILSLIRVIILIFLRRRYYREDFFVNFGPLLTGHYMFQVDLTVKFPRNNLPNSLASIE